MAEGQHRSRVTAPSVRPRRGQSLWQSCIEQLAQELPEQQFNTWIKPLSATVADDLSKVTIYVGNRFKLDWIRAQYSARIAATLEKMVGQPVLPRVSARSRETIAKISTCIGHSGRNASRRGTRRIWAKTRSCRSAQEPPQRRH